eukprot:528207-Hanusia_phi.AAC.2
MPLALRGSKRAAASDQLPPGGERESEPQGPLGEHALRRLHVRQHVAPRHVREAAAGGRGQVGEGAGGEGFGELQAVLAGPGGAGDGRGEASDQAPDQAGAGPHEAAPAVD